MLDMAMLCVPSSNVGDWYHCLYIGGFGSAYVVLYGLFPSIETENVWDAPELGGVFPKNATDVPRQNFRNYISTVRGGKERTFEFHLHYARLATWIKRKSRRLRCRVEPFWQGRPRPFKRAKDEGVGAAIVDNDGERRTSHGIDTGRDGRIVLCGYHIPR